MVVRFIDDHRDRFGVAPICRVLSQHNCPIAPSTYYAARSLPPSARAVRDAGLSAQIARVFADRELGRGLAGARKVWHLLKRQDSSSTFGPVARCTVERLMRQMGIHGVRRGRFVVTTRSDPAAVPPADLVDRDFTTTAPNQLWVADFTKWEGRGHPGARERDWQGLLRFHRPWSGAGWVVSR